MKKSTSNLTSFFVKKSKALTEVYTFLECDANIKTNCCMPHDKKGDGNYSLDKLFKKLFFITWYQIQFSMGTSWDEKSVSNNLAYLSLSIFFSTK